MDTTMRFCVSAMIFVTYLMASTEAKYCADGHSCSMAQECCGTKCCYLEHYNTTYRSLKWSVWNMWYFWFIVIFILMTCFGTCGYWRRRHIILSQRHPGANPFIGSQFGRPAPAVIPTGVQRYHMGALSQPAITVLPGFEVGFINGRHHVIATAARPVGATPPHGVFPAPPPYAEVVSKPDLYRAHGEKEGLPPYPGEGQDVYPAPVISHPAAAPPPPPVEPANQLAAHAVPNPATGGTTMDPHQQQGTSFSNSSYVDSDSRDSATRINMSAL